MKIIELKAENIKRLKAVQIKPDGKNVVLGGDNEQGKSSVLDSILYALAGGQSICEKPVRDGEKKGSVKLDLGEFIVLRTFTQSGSTLTITNKDGDIKRSPQAVLDGLVGKLTFDPLAFARMEAKPQRDTLAKLAGLDFTKLDREYQEAYTMRTDANRDATRIKSQLIGKDEIPNAPEAEVLPDDIVSRLTKAQKHNQSVRNAQNELSEMMRRGKGIGADIENQKAVVAQFEETLAKAKARLEDLKQTQAKCRADYTKREKEVSAMETIDEEPIRKELSSLTETNSAVRFNADLRKKKADLSKVEDTIRNLNSNLESIADKKSKLISSAKYPLVGLAVSDEAVLFKGIPIKQASTAEQIKISAAIAMALNPKLRVMLIKDGAYLDQKSLAALQDLASKNDVQLWIERVGAGDEVSVVIEDGGIKENRMGDK